MAGVAARSPASAMYRPSLSSVNRKVMMTVTRHLHLLPQGPLTLQTCPLV